MHRTRTCKHVRRKPQGPSCLCDRKAPPHTSYCYSGMKSKQALPHSTLALGPDLSSDGLALTACLAQSKPVFQRLTCHLKAGAAPDTDLVAAAVRAAQQSGWPSAAVVRELTFHLTSAAGFCCRALRAPDQDAPRDDLETSLATTLSLLCHTLRAATVHLRCSVPGL